MVISRSGGHAVVSADAADEFGFHLPPLDKEMEQRIASRFRAAVIRLTNPLDLGDIFDIDYYAEIVALALAREDVDGVVFNQVFQAGLEHEATVQLVRRIDELVREHNKPVALVLFARDEAVKEVSAGVGIPVFSEPLEAVRALDRSRQRHLFRAAAAAPSESLPELPVIKPETAGLFRAGLEEAARRDGFLFLDQALELLAAYGLPVAPFQLVRDRFELREAAREIGFPLVLKVVAEGLSHKSDQGGVLTGISDRRVLDDVGDLLFERFAAAPGFCGVLVQKEVEIETEVIAGARRDPSFGPLFLLGLGGIYAEIFKDFALEPGPLDRKRVENMIGRLRGGRILTGARGRSGVEMGALFRVMAGLEALMRDFPEITEVEINPLACGPTGAGVVVDGRVIVGPAGIGN